MDTSARAFNAARSERRGAALGPDRRPLRRLVGVRPVRRGPKFRVDARMTCKNSKGIFTHVPVCLAKSRVAVGFVADRVRAEAKGNEQVFRSAADAIESLTDGRFADVFLVSQVQALGEQEVSSQMEFAARNAVEALHAWANGRGGLVVV